MDPTPIVDARPADSSPAAAATPDPAGDPLESLSETDLQTWRMTGALPTEKQDPKDVTPPADSSSAPAVQDQPASTDAPPKPTASEPVAPTKGAEARIPELLADRSRERDRAERAERRIAELEAATRQPPPDARPAASSAAPAGLVEPDPETYAYGTADPKYLRDLTDYTVKATLAQERATREDADRTAALATEHSRIREGWRTKVEAARLTHPDFDAVALQQPTEIPPGSLADAFILESPHGAAVLYHLQSTPAEQRRILALAPMDQISELVLLGNRLTAAPAGPSSTSAPPPPPVLGTRAAPGDAVERALAADDTAAYIREMNARELAALKR